MQSIIFAIHVILAIVLVGAILIQQGKGADAGAAFGAGASGTVFGSRGSGNFLSRSTAVLAVLFFATSSYLAYFAAREGSQNSSIIDTLAGEESTIPSMLPEGDIPDIVPSELPSLPVETPTEQPDAEQSSEPEPNN